MMYDIAINQKKDTEKSNNVTKENYDDLMKKYNDLKSKFDKVKNLI